MQFNTIASELGRFSGALQLVDDEIKKYASDIKVKLGYPVMICCAEYICFLSGEGQISESPFVNKCWKVTQEDIEEMFYRFCGYAVYSHVDELRQGFVSVNRRLRVGVSGTAVIEEGVFKTVKNITGLSIRVPRDIHGCAKALYRAGVRPEHGVLIAGAPASGKTTLLRDYARELGNRYRTTVLDERYELKSGLFDLGVCTDVLEGYPKQKGFSHAIRCLSPQFILCDEVDDADLPAIRSALFSGVSIIATVHAGSRQELCSRAVCCELMQSGAFGYVVLLKGRTAPTEIQKVFEVDELLGVDSGITSDLLQYSNRRSRII